MINNPKDIQEILNVIDNITKEQLDEAIRRADEMNEEETISILEDMLEKAGKLYEEEFYTIVEDKQMWAVRGLLDLYNKEKENNKKLEEVIKNVRQMHDTKCKIVNNLAQAIRFMSTNENLTVEDIIKEFSKQNKVTEEFMERWEKSQHEESHLKDKVIDLMAEDISMDNCLKVMEGACKRIKECYQEMGGNISCEQCAKEYYFNKVKEKKDVTKNIG